MTYYLTYENHVRGYKCTRCGNFVVYEEFTSHTCKCYGDPPKTTAQNSSDVKCGSDTKPSERTHEHPANPSERVPSPPRKKRYGNWHLDPKYKEQWHGPGGPWKKD